ncbi:MAG: hypothetical protein II867_02885, partial [Clostridia bacterium]|nr:hypothetical protein [Clostridia bacterium]
MKRKILIASFAAVLVVSLCLVAFVACNPDDITHFRLDLNDKNADYTQEYREAHSIESRNIVKVVNKDLYKNFCTGLPTGNDMIAPSGKAFAGWYFDKNNYEGTEFSEYNWNRFQRDAEDGEKKYVLYARWIPVGQHVIYFDLNNKDADYTATYRASHNNFDHRTPEVIVSSSDVESKLNQMPLLPNVHFTVPNDVNFDDWYLEDGSKATIVNLLTKINAGEVQIKVVAHWQEKPKAYVNCSFPETIPGSGIYFGFAQGQQSNFYVLRENVNDLLQVLPTKAGIVCYIYNAELEESVKYSGEEAFATFEWKIAVFDEEYSIVEMLEINQANWLATVENLGEYSGVTVIFEYT